jgi:Tol biopolymer transport system component
MIIDKALEKDPADRYQSTRDLVVDLKRAQRSPAWSPGGRADGEPRPLRRNTRSVLAAALLLLAAAAAILWRAWPANPDRANPLTSAQFRRLTDFEGAEFDAALSADGSLLAFLSDRDGPVDLWVTHIGTGQFSNLTNGRWRLLSLPITVRAIAFSPEGTHIGVNVGGPTELVPVLGGTPRPLLDPGIEAVWSLDGKKLAFHELTPGDPIYIADADGSNRTPLFKAEPGQHNHFLSWSPDGRYLYFARGLVTSDEMDVWRIPTRGGEPERLTFHNARTSYPLALDDQSLLYISTAPDAARTILYSMDLRQRVPRPIYLGVQQYLSLAACDDRRRLVITESRSSGTLWTVPISEGLMDEDDAARLELPNARAVAPRAAPGYLLYLSSTGGADGLWRFERGAASELWNGDRGGLVAAPAVLSDGTAVAFSVRQEGHTRLYRAAGGGANPALLAPSLEVRGAPSWSPDGRWVAVSGGGADGPGLFKVPANGGSPVRLLQGLYFHPLWSPDGQFIVYAEDDESGGTLRVRAITPEGNRVPVADLRVDYVSDPYRFVPGSKMRLVVLQGGAAGEPQNFWLVDLESGRRRQLTKFRPTTTTIRSFDVTSDGRTIVFDRTRENADIVLIERGGRSRLAAARSQPQR